MESVSSIPTFFLVAAGIFAVIVLLLVVMVWLGRRWFIRPLHQLSQDLERLKEGEHQPSPPVQIGIAPEEITGPGGSACPQAIPVGLSPMPATSRQDRPHNDFYEMCCLVHDQITMSMGEASLLAVQYDSRGESFEVAYPDDGDEQINRPAEDKRLWRLIQTGQPVQETTETGSSWLGVPMRSGKEVLGALVVQKTYPCAGFDETAQRLLSNLAAQVAIVLHNRSQANATLLQVEQSQALASLTRKIWAYTDRDVILRTALEEVGRMLHASSGMIQLEVLIDGVSNPPGQHSTEFTINGVDS